MEHTPGPPQGRGNANRGKASDSIEVHTRPLLLTLKHSTAAHLPDVMRLLAQRLTSHRWHSLRDRRFRQLSSPQIGPLGVVLSHSQSSMSSSDSLRGARPTYSLVVRGMKAEAMAAGRGVLLRTRVGERACCVWLLLQLPHPAHAAVLILLSSCGLEGGGEPVRG